MTNEDKKDTARRHYVCQYLFDILNTREEVIAKHAQITYTKRYLIYRDGYLYTGTDTLSDVVKLINNGIGLYTYKVNKTIDLPHKNN